MSGELSFKPLACTEYEKLLEECTNALNCWNERRAGVCESRASGQKIGGELLRLQANYAKAYTVLRNHAHRCAQCQMVSRIAKLMSKIDGRNSENDSHSRSDTALHA